MTPVIYFYIPEKQWPSEGIPEDIDADWQLFNSGVFASTLQTYLRLAADGFPCQLTASIPSEGILVAYRDSLPSNWRPGSQLLFVCIQADRDPHPWAHFHVMHNPQALVCDNGYYISKSYYIPRWVPAPGLIRRNPDRRDRFENIAFFGDERELASELKQASWQEKLHALGLRWQVVERDRWNDYSAIDAIVALGSFEEEDLTIKPVLQLYNAWYAGVPAILGSESALIAERLSELDYLEATSADDAIALIQRLRDDWELRRAMIENGWLRVEERRPSVVLKMWRDFLQKTVVPAYKHWRTASKWMLRSSFTCLSFTQTTPSLQRYGLETRTSTTPPSAYR